MDPKQKGNPKVISDTQGEEITPDNPEIVKQFPVDTTDPKEVKQVETEHGTEDFGGNKT